MESLSIDTNSLEETLERWFLELDFQKKLTVNSSEAVPVEESLDRITSGPVYAEVSSPDFYAASLDGIAVLSSKIFSASSHNPVRLKINQEAHFVDTGSVMPPGTDAVVPIENVKFPSFDQAEIFKFCAPWENVRPLGEDVAAREIILPAYHRIRPLDVSALFLGGLANVSVIRQPRIGILSIGSGLLPAGSEPEAGKIIETNPQIISGIVKMAGGRPVILDMVPETVEALLSIDRESLKDLDLLVAIGGPSLGTAPIANLISHLGELVSYGVRIKPGMSTCLGVINGLPVIGVPRYALSSFIIFKLFGLPLIYARLGIDSPKPSVRHAYLSQDIESAAGVDEFIRVSLGDVEDLSVAVPVSRGAQVLMSLVRADGIVRVDSGTRCLKAGDRVDVELLRNENDISRKVLVAGTYDICFDILRNHFQRRFPKMNLLSSNIGSMRGLMALNAGYCHMASIHLFDDETGQFNIPFVKKFVQEIPLIMVNLFNRRLGFIVARGNPKNITGFSDLVREDVRIVNRIRGSGTRLIFDYYLRKNQIEINRIRGYSFEAHTHLNLASAVASGNADAGLGILEAAKAVNLDFIPAVPEQLDLVIPKKHLSNGAVRSLLEVVGSETFQREFRSLGGYDTSRTGKVIFEK